MVEYHPLKPFLPANAKVLFLGSFPPPKKRWCMDFFYPNFINDHWRIEGQIWFGATAVNRLKDNASDAFLEIVEHTDIRSLLAQMPQCHAIATTGEKATTEVCTYFNVVTIPSPNTKVALKDGLSLYRLPSSSRAYPLSFDKKVEAYRRMFETVFGDF